MKFAMFHLKCLGSWLWFHFTLASTAAMIVAFHLMFEAKIAMAAGIVTLFLGVLLAIYDRLCDLVQSGAASHNTLNVHLPPVPAEAFAAFMAAKNKEQA